MIIHCIFELYESLHSPQLNTSKYTLNIFGLVSLLDQAQFVVAGTSRQQRHEHQMQLWQHLNDSLPQVIRRVGVNVVIQDQL